jgi:glutaredoxin-related protein
MRLEGGSNMADNVLVKIDEQVKGNKVIVYMKGKRNFPQ